MALTPAERRRRNAIELLNMAMLMAATSGSSAEVAVITLVYDDLELSTPVFAITSTQPGTMYFDLHSVSSPNPAAGSGDQGFVTQAISSGTTVFTLDLSSLAGLTGYPHVSVVNSAGRSNVLVLQQITVPSGGSWTPADLTGLVAWYDAQNAGSLTLSGADVTQWNDLSGNGRHLTPPTAAKPTYSATGFNSLPSVRSTAVGQSLRRQNVTPTTGNKLSAFGVVRMESGTEANGRWFSMMDETAFQDYSTASGAIFGARSGSTLYGYRNNVTGGNATFNTATNYRIGSVYDGTNHTMYANNVAGTPAAISGNFGTNTVAFYLFCNNNDEDFLGEIPELFVFTDTVDSTLLNNIDAYLRAKWNL